MKSESNYTLDEAYDDIQAFLAPMNINITQVSGYSADAWITPKRPKIYINTDRFEHPKELWSTVFHELVHVLCYNEKKYMRYHSGKPQTIEYLRRMTLRVERYVDKRAEKLFNLFFPGYGYYRMYRTKRDALEVLSKL